MSDNPKVTDKCPSLVIPGYIYSANGKPLTLRLRNQNMLKESQGTISIPGG
jgi:hypothetical protein